MRNLVLSPLRTGAATDVRGVTVPSGSTASAERRAVVEGEMRESIMAAEMAGRNPRWGAERIRGELLKLGIHVCNDSEVHCAALDPEATGQSWSTFLRNRVTWACDFVPARHSLDLRSLAGDQTSR